MKTRILDWMLVSVLLTGVVWGQAGNPEVRAGNGLRLTLRGVPAEDSAQVTGLYQISDRGTIRLPHLEQRLRVVGLKIDEVSEAVENAYRRAGIYAQPTVEAILVLDPRPEGDAATVSVGGFVARAGRVPYKPGMILVEAIQGAGDRTAFGGRNMTVLRKGKLIKLDFRAHATKNFVLETDDVVTVEKVGITEFDRG